MKEAQYTFLNVTNKLQASTIYADEIVLKDNILKSDLDMCRKRLKTIYESNDDCNVFTDKHKNIVENTEKNFTLAPYVSTNIPNIQELYENSEKIPNNSSTLCVDEFSNLIHFCKINNTIKLFKIPEYEPIIQTNFNISDDSVSINISQIN